MCVVYFFFSFKYSHLTLGRRDKFVEVVPWLNGLCVGLRSWRPGFDTG